MTPVVGAVLSPGRTEDLIAAPEWDCLCTLRHNVLLEGPEDSTDYLVRILEPALRGPVLWQALPASFALPARHGGALVLQHVEALCGHQQADLLEWLDDSNERRQVVSTTARPLFPLVERRLFDEVLYYRLNVMLLHVGPSGSRSPESSG